ncbi:integrase [Parabacteroides sp. PH5-13]|uniref:tyrosine-type recombinase/integrase n=1 Tax=unclassified Parabacteroides TaxID=2649774 RepID=UPI002474928F|nr:MULTISPECIES: site-specific integrase [unclassified Parabacteroides]MDH6305237.1 integrase [Parabacteroides sp. PH5-39]MDH6320230.1 integrase [Parabacteroides sp. PH5-13]MDH6323827.1 integrase [Parabacteroides sp. PH5-8]MDH6384939.1 integrase [Parabacteroides sp. PH5-17]MDH6394427.1 integrase [Parabacteroides sp. PFB2-22]
MISVKFMLRASSVEGRASRLFVRIISNRTAFNVSTRIQLYPCEWNLDRQMIIPQAARGERSAHLAWAKAELESDRYFVESTALRLEREGTPDAAKVAAAYRLHKEKICMADYTDKLVERLLKRGQIRTARAYQTVLARFINFSKKPRMTFDAITPLLMKNFESQLSEEGLARNSISFYMRNLRAIYNKGAEEGLFQAHSISPFRDVFTGNETTKKRTLSKKEMNLLDQVEAKLQSSEPTGLPFHLQQALLMFLFSFHARGMSYVDMAFLKKEDLKNDVISYKRMKTGQRIELKVNRKLKDILEIFKPLTEESTYLLPIITRKNVSPRLQYESGLRRQNQKLREISQFLGLKNKLTTHVARHTWASIAKEANLPLAVISEALGHTSEATTRIYLASFDRSVLDKANETVAKAVAHAM